MELRLVESNDFCAGLRSTGSHPDHVVVQAFCQCGWTGPTHPWLPGAGDDERDELAAHIAATGHHPFTWGVPTPDAYHGACGHFHDLNDACPVPADSPRGRLQRITAELEAWLHDQEAQALIGARLAGCTWTDIASAVGVTVDDATRRWGPMIGRYERAGLLDPDPSPTAAPQSGP